MDRNDLMECSDCGKGFKVIFIFTQGLPSYCPYCRAKIIDDYDDFVFKHHGEVKDE